MVSLCLLYGFLNIRLACVKQYTNFNIHVKNYRV